MRSRFLSTFLLPAVAAATLAAARAEDPAPTAKPAPSRESTAASRRAVAAMQENDWLSARRAWNEVVRLDPANAGAWSNLGKVEHQLGELKTAAEHLEKAVALKPALSDSWVTLGLVYMELAAPMRAVSCLTRAVHENPADPQPRNALAIILKKVGWTAAAESELQKAIDLEPKFAEAHFNLAVMYLERRPPALEMARRHYSAARQLGSEPDTVIEEQLSGKDPAATPDEPSSEPADDDESAAPPAPDSAAPKPPAPTKPARPTPTPGKRKSP